MCTFHHGAGGWEGGGGGWGWASGRRSGEAAQTAP